MSKALGLHLFRSPPGGKTVIHRAYTAASVPSNRERSPAARELLNALGRRARVYELQGPLTFATTEIVIRDVLAHAADLGYAVCDLSRVLSVDAAAADLLASLAASWSTQGKRIVFVQPDMVLQQSHPLERASKDATFADLDPAIEWCENRLLPAPPSSDESAPLHSFDLLADLDPADLESVRQLARAAAFPAGQGIVRAGDRDDAVYLLTRGEVSVAIALPGGRDKRLATFSAGMCFGEMALLEDLPRSATIVADTDVACPSLLKSDLTRLWDRRPTVKATMLGNIAVTLGRRLRRTNKAVAALAS